VREKAKKERELFFVVFDDLAYSLLVFGDANLQRRQV
jgi:hypothetical protein